MSPRNGRLLALWGVSAMALTAWLAARFQGTDRSVFLPGATTAGHHQIELACNACHAEAFAGPEPMQAACVGCHGDALTEARDSHPQTKFTDPRNADRAAKLDARYCVTCHVEHRPEMTTEMGLTVPADFCVLCHEDVGSERATHVGLEFTTCASSGCHNFHDNRALYEDFLLKHLDEPVLLSERTLEQRNFASILAFVERYPRALYPPRALTAAEHDAPAGVEVPASVLDDWATTAHAASGVNCSACHTDALLRGAGTEERAPADADAWQARPDAAVCAGCHAEESATFLEGKHGMRRNAAKLGVALPPLTPALARLAVRPEAAHTEVGCTSCHGAHRFDTAFAAVEGCLGCHADEHSLAYVSSPHGESWARARRGDGVAEEAVTCATCHMPRVSKSYDFGAYVHVLVQHNQSDTLRPNDKMLRPVCLECHGLGFSLNALADVELIRNNFAGEPRVHVQSLELAEERRRAVELEREQARARAAAQGADAAGQTR